MPTVYLPVIQATVTFASDYKPGDPPPSGYVDWHEWADVQRKAGLRQSQCPQCSKWRYPQELSTHEVRWSVLVTRGKNKGSRTFTAFACLDCAATREPSA